MTDNLWHNIIQNLQGKINSQDLEVWFAGSNVVSSSQERIIIEFNDERKKNHVENFYLTQLNDAVHTLLGRSIKIDLITNQWQPPKPYATISLQEPEQTPPLPTTNQNYTFDSFIVGSNNEIAQAAALSVAQNPGTENNPLFIWGGVGLGKTHLLQAIANKLQQEKNYLKILYTRSEDFMNEIIAAIHKKETSHFKLKYRYVDVLLIDDIQFIEGGKVTQQEFFHTFNTLYESGRQIVISSDRPPKNLTYLTDRIINRFEWGLITKISSPDLATRINILKHKASSLNLTLNEDLIYFIAKNIKNDIRNLEGALTKAKFLQQHMHTPITISNISSILNDYIPTEGIKKQITLNDILLKVAKHYTITKDELTSKSRVSKLIQPRFVAIYLITQLTSLTTKEIGRQLGGRDHSTIINARNEIQKQIAIDPQLKSTVQTIQASL